MNKLEKYNQANQFVRAAVQPVVVTTEARGVFFGYLSKEEKDEHGNVTVTLTNARNCVYWSADVRGFIGLAATGPTNSCRVGLAAPSIKLMKVTSILEASSEATEAWEHGPWHR